MLLPFRGNIAGGSENEGGVQDVDRPQDCILAVSDVGVPETEVALTDPEPEGEGDAIHIQCILTVEKPNYLIKTIWGWINLYIGTNNDN